MNCDHYITKITDVLTGEITKAEKESCLSHYMTCGPCGKTFEALSGTWDDLGSLPDHSPSANVSKRFYAMLEGAQTNQPVQSLQTEKKTIPFPNRVWFQAFAAAALIAFGFLLGRPVPKRTFSLDQVNIQDDNLLWYQAPSAMARLQAISNLPQQQSQPNKQLQPILFFVLERDTSVDVRLAALRAIKSMAPSEELVKNLTQSVLFQEEPLVQIEILDYLVELNLGNTTQTLETLLQREPLNPFVKQRAQELLLEIR